MANAPLFLLSVYCTDWSASVIEFVGYVVVFLFLMIVIPLYLMCALFCIFYGISKAWHGAKKEGK